MKERNVRGGLHKLKCNIVQLENIANRVCQKFAICLQFIYIAENNADEYGTGNDDITNAFEQKIKMHS